MRWSWEDGDVADDDVDDDPNDARDDGDDEGDEDPLRKVGKMELFSSTFSPAVMRVMESNIPMMATIPLPRYG